MKIRLLLSLCIPWVCVLGEEAQFDETEPSVSEDSDYESEPCNPLWERYCFATNPALGTSIFDSFRHNSVHFRVSSFPHNVNYSDEGLQLVINSRYENPSVRSNFYILYGEVNADIKLSPGKGVISSFYLQSNDLDEIDIMESFGGDLFRTQSNYFVKGNTSNYNRGEYHSIPNSPQNEYINFGIEWTPEYIAWKISGNVVRKVSPSIIEGFPDSPMFIKLSLWIGGDPDNDTGTISWSGGVADFTQLPFAMWVRNMHVSDYSTGSHYVYGNLDGNWVQLNSHEGSIYGKEERADVSIELTEEQIQRYEQHERDEESISSPDEDEDEDYAQEEDEDEEGDGYEELVDAEKNENPETSQNVDYELKEDENETESLHEKEGEADEGVSVDDYSEYAGSEVHITNSRASNKVKFQLPMEATNHSITGVKQKKSCAHRKIAICALIKYVHFAFLIFNLAQV